MPEPEVGQLEWFGYHPGFPWSEGGPCAPGV